MGHIRYSGRFVNPSYQALQTELGVESEESALTATFSAEAAIMSSSAVLARQTPADSLLEQFSIQPQLVTGGVGLVSLEQDTSLKETASQLLRKKRVSCDGLAPM